MFIELHWLALVLGSIGIGLAIAVRALRGRADRGIDEQLRAILDAVPQSLFFKDTDSHYRVVNHEFERVFHIDGRLAMGKSDKELFGADLHDRFLLQDKELMISGGSQTYDEEIMVEGDLRSIQSRKRPVYDQRGRLRGIVGVAIDVTVQKVLQRQLEDANARLGIALEAAHLGIWEWNLSTGEIAADARVRAILGLGPEDQDISAVSARIHPHDRERIRAIFATAPLLQGSDGYEFRVVDEAGEIRWVEGFATLDLFRGRSDCVIGVNRDITERRLGEIALSEAKQRADQVLAKLEESQDNLELAISVGGLGVWRSVTRMHEDSDLLDSAFADTVITADRTLRQIYGQDADLDIRYRDFLELLHPEDRGRVAATLELVYRRGGGAHRDQFRIRSREGVLRTLDVRGSLTVAEDPEAAVDGTRRRILVSFTGIAKDITREEALKADLIAKAEEARSALEAKRLFLAMMSHELRTPLSGVLGMIDLVLGTRLNDSQRSMLVRSRESSVALLKIINDILDFSKIRAGKLDLETRPLSLRSLLEDVCATFTPESARKAIKLGFDIDPDVAPFVMGDGLRLRQVLTNLIGNAIKFTHRGGVRVEVHWGADGFLELVVEDTGIGIDPKATSSLFEAFQQAEIGTARRYGGTGLGLTIVKQLVGLMQGTIRCDSELDRGSRFTVRLPLPSWIPTEESILVRAQEDQTCHETIALSIVPNASRLPADGRTVLLAEDHEINREVISLQLATLGLNCECAEDGEKAWEMLRADEARYAMLLTDCHMPRLDGYELTRRQRAHEQKLGLARIPIVALTANALQGEAERGLALGMDAYLSKPLHLAELQTILEALLPRQPDTKQLPEPLIDQRFCSPT